MEQMELGEVQERFAKLVWANAPIPSGELVKLCEKELNWKKPTTYTVLRKLCERGLFENVNGIVETRIPQEAFYSAKSEQFVDSTFNGSLPAFLAAFTSRKGLSDEEADEIMQMIEKYRKENRR
ncbi:MAG: BlaI/MecI/CopY family transcriptional regulator [Clostridia bacterium]|nr:BlaI/MecI/CopY family transcriptional regulator [Clostridia bacterium]MBR6006586.1 BlaI/MecI/CopY family transcriptional regulator [Clostridia bacterium]